MPCFEVLLLLSVAFRRPCWCVLGELWLALDRAASSCRVYVLACLPKYGVWRVALCRRTVGDVAVLKELLRCWRVTSIHTCCAFLFVACLCSSRQFPQVGAFRHATRS